MDKVILVPEYMSKFITYLKEVSAENSEWNFDICSKRFLAWKEMVEPYLNSKDLDYHIGTKSFSGSVQGRDYSITDQSNNIFDATRESFRKWLIEK